GIRQVGHDDRLDARGRGVRLAAHTDPAGDVRIDADAADVFPHTVDHEYVDLIHWQARHAPSCRLQELRLLVGNLVRLQHPYHHRLMTGVLHQRNAGENLPRGEHLPRTGSDQLAQTVHAERVDGERAFQLAEADQRHLHQAAFVTPVIIAVRLDSVDQDDAV